MMKKLLVLILVLAMGSLASADLMLTVSSNEAMVGGSVDVGIDAADHPANIAVFLLLNGVGSLNVEGALNIVGDGLIAKTGDLGLPPGDLGADDAAFAELVILSLPTPNMPNGVVVSGVKLSSDVEGVAMLSLTDSDTGAVLGTQEVTFVPEPASLILLGLGGLLLRRRK